MNQNFKMCILCMYIWTYRFIKNKGRKSRRKNHIWQVSRLPVNPFMRYFFIFPLWVTHFTELKEIRACACLDDALSLDLVPSYLSLYYPRIYVHQHNCHVILQPFRLFHQKISTPQKPGCLFVCISVPRTGFGKTASIP